MNLEYTYSEKKTSFELWRETNQHKLYLGDYPSLEKAEKALSVSKNGFFNNFDEGSKYSIRKVETETTYTDFLVNEFQA